MGTKPEKPEVPTVRLEKWSMTTVPKDAYQPPEACRPALQGYIYGLEGFPDGSHVATGKILGTEGRIITCEHSPGSIKVRLGRIDKEYRSWLRKHRPAWDWRNPVTIIRK
jgi:hypothetical protein